MLTDPSFDISSPDDSKLFYPIIQNKITHLSYDKLIYMRVPTPNFTETFCDKKLEQKQ